MPFPLLPFLWLGGAAVTGAVIGRTSGNPQRANVVVNSALPEEPRRNLTDTALRGALLGGTALAVVTFGPRIISGKK